MTTNTSPRQSARLSKRISDFFYQEEVPFALALVRIVMPMVLLSVMLPRWFHARELYSSDGASTPLAFVYGWQDMLPTFSGEVVVLMHSVLIFALIASSLGWCSRLSLTISTLLYVYLNMMDSVSTMTKYSVIASHAMLLLTLSNCGAVWSVDAWLAGRHRRKNGLPQLESGLPRFPIWPQRLMQLMIGIVYFGAAITKMHTPEFFSGDQMTFWMLSHVNWANPGGELLSQFPTLVVASAYITIVWEILFLFLAWRGLGRTLMISLGLMFHIMTAIVLGLYTFPLVCATIYLGFLREDDIRALAARFRRLRRRWKWSSRKNPALEPVRVPADLGRRRKLSWAAYSGGLLLVAVAGLIVEYQRDPYGLRRPEGRYTLKEVSPEVAQAWLNRTEPIRDADKIFSFDIGTLAFGDSLANRRREFQQGDMLIAQVSLNPPHEDMLVQCNLHDAEDRVIDRVDQMIPRSKLRVHFPFRLTSAITPGEYQLVLRTGGQEVGRRIFRLKPSAKQPDPRTASAN